MGEGALAISWQEALTRELAPNEYEELLKSPLTYEWAFTLAELLRQEKLGVNDTLARHPDLIQYALIMSERMRLIDDISESEIINSNGNIINLYKLAKDSYYAHSGLHDMEWRRDRLEKFNLIIDRYMETKPFNYKGTIHPTMHDQRIHASVLEELGSMERDSYENNFLERAFEANRSIVDDLETPLYMPHKVHALFSMHDIKWREQMSSFYGNENQLHTLNSGKVASEVQLGFYRDIYKCAQYLEELTPNTSDPFYDLYFGRAASMTGTLYEITALGEIRDFLLDNSLQNSVDARKAFVREDARFCARDEDGNSKEITAPNMSFDLVLQKPNEHGPLSRLNIEVKKGKKAESYLSETYVLSAGDASKPDKFANKLKRYAKGKIAHHKGTPLTYDQKHILNEFKFKIKPDDIVEQFVLRCN
jgi:hypothetical protein